MFPPSFIFDFFRNSSVVIGKFRTVMLAEGYCMESSFKTLPEKGITSFTVKIRPGKSVISLLDVYKWLFLCILDIEKEIATDLNAPAFKIEELGSYRYVKIDDA